ncbi:late competence development ComFB family protein [Isachenkonia alkalipeptolytica]|uniref:Competence protein ComFB n=1 Tax=Isachenkonia alkalipeptolytica TaxID=2565777 RepID=A0AA44BG07_9CLOT|nr:late competence development ComFB family protein [Isachenkonia alkalipeptolytica]NBG89385.1 competence protein ComFB [Isachenkonia alkalipeptolytica]
MIKNYMEILVEEHLSEVIKDQEHIQNCEKCQEDVQAIALNNLKPMYVVTEKGSLYAKVNEFSLQFKSDVLRELIRAAEKVTEKPQHDEA